MRVNKSLGNKQKAIKDGEEILHYIDQIKYLWKWIDEKLENNIKREIGHFEPKKGNIWYKLWLRMMIS